MFPDQLIYVISFNPFNYAFSRIQIPHKFGRMLCDKYLVVKSVGHQERV